ncbi:MAG: transporter permease [Clostridia bacterium]|jgi:ABC-2 type transport system permease protein|nr:transporter permease [Clostridia bacterium]
MKLYYIINNSLKRKIKDYKSLGIMIVFPTILTFIFIMVFGNIDTRFKISQEEKLTIEAAFYSQGEAAFNEKLGAFLSTINKEGQINLTYQFFNSREEAQEELDQKKADVLAIINKGEETVLYGGDNNTKKAETLKAILQSFSEHTALAKLAENNGLQITTEKHQYDKHYSVKTIPQSDKNFYVISIAVTMISFAVLMAGSYGTSQVYYIRRAVGKRVQSAPISQNTIYFGEYISGVIMAFMQGSILVLICDMFFDIGFKNNVLQMIGILTLLSMMSVAIGICIGALIKNEKVSGGMVSIVIMILCFTSGGFNPNMDLGKIVTFSPITAVNNAMIDICMKHGAQNLIQALGILLGITFICLATSVISINRNTREVN